MYKEITQCRICGSQHLTHILSLGDLAVSDFLTNDENNQVSAPLDLVICDQDERGCGLVQLKHTVSAETMYRNYWYRSGINQTMIEELNDIVNAATKKVSLTPGDYVIDIGANDGTLLRAYTGTDVNTIGFEPAENLYQYGSQGTTKIFCDFFNKAVFNQTYKDSKAKIITAIGMFYDLDDPNSFVAEIKDCLHEDGIFIIQMMYMPCALERNAFDGICHEHLGYYSMASLENLLKRHDLEIVDIEMREHINEGSARFFIGHKPSKSTAEKFLLTSRVQELREKEQNGGANSVAAYRKFAERVEQTKSETVELLSMLVKGGKVIHGYAASTKGNTTLQYYQINSMLIEKIADRNPDKWGLKTVATNIPIVSEDESRKQQPDYYFVLAWHFLPEFIQREKEFIERGGKFIVPLPQLRII